MNSIMLFSAFVCLFVPRAFGNSELKIKMLNDSRNAFTHYDSKPSYLAQKSGGARKRRLSAEGKVRKNGDKTTIDFDSISISGERKTPLGSMINQNRADKEYDFVKIRLRWHPEMKKSATSLDTSR